MTIRHRGALRRVVGCLGSLLLVFAIAACTPGAQDDPPPDTESTSPPDATRYVSPTGDDAAPGTEQEPWRTLRRAVPALQRGELLYVRGGDYHEELVKVPLHAGTRNKPITVMAYPGERPVVHGIVWLRRPEYWTIDGLNVTWDPALDTTARQMVKVTGGVGWIWRNSEIWGSQGLTNLLVEGYEADEPEQWSVTGNCIHDVSPPADVWRTSNLTTGDLRQAGLGGDISRNVIFNPAGAQNVALGTATGGLRNVTMQYNTVYGGEAALGVAGEVTGLRVSKNLFGGVSSGLVVRWTEPQGTRNSISQNFAVQATTFMRPETAAVVGGPGNVIDSEATLDDVSSCGGFGSADPSVLPYGVRGVG